VDEFRAFLLRGNIVDLAVAVIMGIAFLAVVNSLVADLIMPLIAMIIGEPDFSGLTFTINDSVFRYGAFINTLVSLILVAAVVFYFIVLPMNRMMARFQETPDATTRPCPRCLSAVPLDATRCAFCTSELDPATA
jgi:large conductance mechanosensitive channel